MLTGWDVAIYEGQVDVHDVLLTVAGSRLNCGLLDDADRCVALSDCMHNIMHDCGRNRNRRDEAMKNRKIHIKNNQHECGKSRPFTCSLFRLATSIACRRVDCLLWLRPPDGNKNMEYISRTQR